MAVMSTTYIENVWQTVSTSSFKVSDTENVGHLIDLAID
jgi:hypothetical protein